MGRYQFQLIFVIIFLVTTLASCIVVNNPTNQYGTHISNYKPIPINRVRNGITYFNTHNIQKIRTKGIPIEIVKSHKAELEVVSNHIEYLKVLRFDDEIYIFYDMPTTGPESGFRRFDHKITLHIRQPMTNIVAEESSNITMLDMLTTPHMNIVMIGSKVKANIKTDNLNIFAKATGGFSGWIDASNANITLQNAALADIGGVIDYINISTSESSFFGGKELRANKATIFADTKSSVFITINEELDAKAYNRAKIQYHTQSKALINRDINNGGIIEEY